MLQFYNSTFSIFKLYLLIIETNFLLTLIFIGFLYLIFNLFWSSISGFTWFFDWVSRIDINDSFLNSFNFFWTTFLYLPSFFFGIFFTYLLYSNLRLTNIFIILFLTFFLLYNIEICDFLILNLSTSTNDLNYTSLNLLLTNNLNKYHPFIFYSSVLVLLTLVVSNLSIFNIHPNFRNNLFSETVYNLTRKILNINLIALFLGSWWALQEGTWGGWWNWDPSEVLGLLFTLIGLLHVHSNINYYNVIIIFYRLLYTIFFTCFSYIFIQLNFDLVSHNFGSKFFFFFNNNLFFFEISLFLIIWNIWFLNILQLTSTNLLIVQFFQYNSYSNKSHIVWIWISLLYLLILILIVNSFIPLINYFIWTYYHINSFNSIISVDKIIISLLIMLTLPFSQTGNLYWKYIIIILIPFQYSLVLVFIFFISVQWHWIYILHAFITYTIITNIVSYNLQFIYWYTLDETGDFYFGSNLMSTLTNIYVCNNFFIDYITLSQTSHQYVFNTWNVFYINNSLSLNTFNLIFNNHNFSNLYNLSTNWNNSFLFIETNYINNLLEVILVIVIFTIFLVSYNPLS